MAWHKIDHRLDIRADSRVLDSLDRIEQLLAAILDVSLERTQTVADDLSDIRSNLQDLNVDLDTVITTVNDTRAALDEALANAGVDQAARDEINGMVDQMQQRIADAINPQVPVDPNVPPAEFSG